jgi:hypothetical protein
VTWLDPGSLTTPFSYSKQELGVKQRDSQTNGLTVGESVAAHGWYFTLQFLITIPNETEKARTILN